EEVDQPRQKKTQRSPARQQRQRILLGLRQLARAAIGVEQRARLGDVEGKIRLETPGVEADRDVVGEDIVAGEREVDQSGKLVAEEEDIVGKQIGVNDADGQIQRPMLFQMLQFARDGVAQARLHAVGAPCCEIEQRTP